MDHQRLERDALHVATPGYRVASVSKGGGGASGGRYMTVTSEPDDRLGNVLSPRNLGVCLRWVVRVACVPDHRRGGGGSTQ